MVLLRSQEESNNIEALQNAFKRMPTTDFIYVQGN